MVLSLFPTYHFLKNVVADSDTMLEDLDKRGISIYPKVEYPHHPTYTQIFFRELSYFLNTPESVDLSVSLIKKYVLKERE